MPIKHCPNCGVKEGYSHMAWCPDFPAPIKQIRNLTQGERKLIAVALEDYAANCAMGIEKMLSGMSDDPALNQGLHMKQRERALEYLNAEVANLKRFRMRAATLAYFIQRNETKVECWITIPEQL